MKLEACFPSRYWINLGRREDRRLEAEARFAECGIHARRFPAVDAFRIRELLASKMVLPSEKELAEFPSKKTVRGYETVGRYALALTQRMAIRKAKLEKSEAVLLFEDDVALHPAFSKIFESLEIPDDWGIFYFGCAHAERPEWVAPRVVRVKRALDTHAFAVRRPYYDKVLRALDGRYGSHLSGFGASDQYLAALHREIPTYACYPNIAWQSTGKSDLIGSDYSNYFPDGRQRNSVAAISGLLDELVDPDRGKPATCEKPKSKVGLLFLTRGDVHHPKIWQEYVDSAPERVRIFSHPKWPGKINGGFLEGTSISANVDTKWGDISLVRATRNLLTAALEDRSLTHFILLSEACIPVRPIRHLLRQLDLDPRSQFSYNRVSEAVPRHACRIYSAPRIPRACWRFQPQWWLLGRAAAIFATSLDYTGAFEKMFAPDEAYFATVLSMQGFPLDGEVIRRDATWSYWKEDAGSPTEWRELPRERLEELIQSGAFFARKFPPDSTIGELGLHL